MHYLDKDGQRQTEKKVTNKCPAVSKLSVDGQRRDVTLPGGLIYIHCKGNGKWCRAPAILPTGCSGYI